MNSDSLSGAQEVTSLVKLLQKTADRSIVCAYAIGTSLASDLLENRICVAPADMVAISVAATDAAMYFDGFRRALPAA
jgi:hypothetical protein